eukprot:TRINITY_DN1821_c0_g1_i1.p1 TRINITY_DN1821_c0_g1~~TRINITY_DN1821_c0_g1_i1.p1  ORF type:complete len:265 (-),score=26.63 TRINITY_DN1821_c0_g1_i1:135-929(-)
MILLFILVGVAIVLLFFPFFNKYRLEFIILYNKLVFHYNPPPQLSASRFAAAAGINPYCSRLELWEQITTKKPQPETEFGRKAKEWGINCEYIGREIYSGLRFTKSVIHENNLEQHHKYSWLVGIPDGLIYNDQTDCLEGVLEIKCPYPRRGINRKNCMPHQKLSRIFYYMPQIQGYMQILNVNYCDLMSFTPYGSTIFRIFRDDNYWSLLFPVLKEFYYHLCTNTPPPDEHPNTKLILQQSISMPWTSVEPECFHQNPLWVGC